MKAKEAEAGPGPISHVLLNGSSSSSSSSSSGNKALEDRARNIVNNTVKLKALGMWKPGQPKPVPRAKSSSSSGSGRDAGRKRAPVSAAKAVPKTSKKTDVIPLPQQGRYARRRVNYAKITATDRPAHMIGCLCEPCLAAHTHSPGCFCGPCLAARDHPFGCSCEPCLAVSEPIELAKHGHNGHAIGCKCLPCRKQGGAVHSTAADGAAYASGSSSSASPIAHRPKTAASAVSRGGTNWRVGAPKNATKAEAMWLKAAQFSSSSSSSGVPLAGEDASLKPCLICKTSTSSSHPSVKKRSHDIPFCHACSSKIRSFRVTLAKKGLLMVEGDANEECCAVCACNTVDDKVPIHVYMCDHCPRSYCGSCCRKILTSKEFKKMTTDEEWRCFSCPPKSGKVVIAAQVWSGPAVVSNRDNERKRKLEHEAHG